MSQSLTTLSVPGLLNLYSQVLQELTMREVIRSTNNPVADYAEHLVVSALGLKRAAKSTKGFDAIDGVGKRYEIKGRRPTSHNPSRMLSAIRDCEAAHFDFLAGVLFREDFTFHKACLIPFSIVLAESKYRKHVNANIFELKDTLWGREGVLDITSQILAAIEADEKRFKSQAQAATAVRTR